MCGQPPKRSKIHFLFFIFFPANCSLSGETERLTLLLYFGLNTEIAFPVKVQKEKIEKNTEYRNRFGTGYFCKATRPKEGIGKTRPPTARKMNVLGSS